MAIVITVAIEKGGVGKTATATNLAALMAMEGKKVLAVDMDGQANTTYMLTGKKKIDGAFKNHGVFDMLRAYELVSPRNFIAPTNIPGLDILPSNTDTPQAIGQLEALSNPTGESENVFLAYCLAEVADAYDYIIIDTPPARDTLTSAALYASDYVLIPLKCDDLAVEGLQTTYSFMRKLEQKEEIEIKLLGIVLTIVERTALTTAIRDELQDSEFKNDMLKTVIRKSQAVSDSTRLGAPVVICLKNSNPSKDYRALYEELKKRIRKMERSTANG